MRYNMFVQQDGSAYGALFCSVCSKNVTLELEHATSTCPPTEKALGCSACSDRRSRPMTRVKNRPGIPL